MEKTPYRVLGYDAGAGTLGWSLIDTANDKIVNGGVHLWDVPQKAKTRESLAAVRRAARSSRRNNKRAKDRKKQAIKVFKKYGLVAEDIDNQWLQTKKGDRPPIELRACGLDRKLTEREFAQALYSFCQRRGYIPHGEGSGDDEGKKVKAALKINQEKLASGNHRTVGEMFYVEERSRNRDGDYSLCVTNSMLVEEVQVLFERQREFGLPCATPEFESEFIATMNWQKDVTDYDAQIYKTVGPCSYFPTEKRAAASDASFEVCRAYEQVGHCMIVHSNKSEIHLPEDIRSWIIETLFSPTPIKGNKDCKITYAAIRKKMKLPATSIFKDVEKDKEKKLEISRPSSWRTFRENISPEFMLRLIADRPLMDQVCEALTYASGEKSLRIQLDDLDITDSEINELCNLPYTGRVFKGYGNRSLKALTLLVEAFEQDSAVTLFDAEQSAGIMVGADAACGDVAKGDRLPLYSVFDPTCTNPVVLRVMSRVRKVTNAIIKEYGMPDEIHIELGRDLKYSEKEKRDINTKNKRTKAKRDALKAQAAELLSCSPDDIHGSLLLKLEFWDEQGHIDPYTGEEINLNKLLHDSAYCEVGHIIPWSRSCDDSRANKVLALQKSVQNKRQLTPYEWFGNTDKWNAFVERVHNIDHYPFKKRDNLLNTTFNDEEEAEKFISRNLNDTRYASRSAKNYIEKYLQFPQNGHTQHVFAVSGGATAVLRHAWGLYKDRDKDQCHHFMDACVIAACNADTVQAIAKASEQKRLVDADTKEYIFESAQPWETFVDEVNAKMAKVVPTHAPNHGFTGRLFEATLYHYEGLNEKGLGILKGKSMPSSNFVVGENGTAMLPDGIAFVRFWRDYSQMVPGKKKPGRFLAEPVYYSDYAHMMDGSYIPRSIPSSSTKAVRSSWSPIPEEVLKQKPLVLYAGDMIHLRGELYRFGGVQISTNSWKLLDPRDLKTDMTNGRSFISITPDDDFGVTHEDLLGKCWN